MKKFILVLIIILPQIICAKTYNLNCDCADVKVQGMNYSAFGFEKVVLSVKKGNDEIKLLFHHVHFGIECRKNLKGKHYLIFQAYCGGSGCRDFDNFGIIDPSTYLRVLLVPHDKNSMTANEIFGKELSPIKTIKGKINYLDWELLEI